MSIYLDNAATSFPKPESVYTAMDRTLRELAGSPGRGGHSGSLAAARLVMAARDGLADLFCVTDSGRFVFTHSATESLNLAVNGLLSPGDHVISSTMEHNSLARPLHAVSKRGVEVSWVSADNEGYVSPEAVKSAIRPDTRLVALSHCSNVTGTIQPIAEIGALAHASGALLLVDAAQSAGSVPISVAEMQIDLLAVPGHKGLMGPPGTGILYVGEGVRIEPLMVGGTGTLSSSLDQPEELPERLESGTMNTPAIAGLAAGISFIQETGVHRIARHEAQLVSMIAEGLKKLPGIRVYLSSRPEIRGNVLSFTADGFDSSRIGYMLDNDYGILVRTGLHCSPQAHRTIGTYPAGTIRVSPGWFTTESDIAHFLEAVQEIMRRG